MKKAISVLVLIILLGCKNENHKGEKNIELQKIKNLESDSTKKFMNEMTK